MRRYIIYDAATGAVLETGFNRSDNVKVTTDAAALWDVRADSDTQYIDLSGDDPALADRAAMDPSVSTSIGQATLSNLPDPCEIVWNGQESVATGGSVTITFDEPGTKSLILKAEPQYLDHKLEVDIP